MGGLDRDPQGGPESRLCYARLFRRCRARAGSQNGPTDERYSDRRGEAMSRDEKFWEAKGRIFPAKSLR